MKKMMAIIMAMLLMSVGLIGCTPKKAGNPSDGSITDTTYANTYFEFKTVFPEGWVLSKEEEDTEFKEFGLFSAIDAENQIVVMGGAETLNGMFFIDEKAYLKSAQTSILEDGGAKISKEIYPETISGKKFAVMEYVDSSSGQELKFRTYATIKDGYAVFFIVIGETDDKVKIGEDIVKASTF